mgnify:CR=1 FL=1
MPVISIPSSDGTSLYAFCKQVPLNSNLLKGDARRIINSIKNEVNNLCRDYISGQNKVLVNLNKVLEIYLEIINLLTEIEILDFKLVLILLM